MRLILHSSLIWLLTIVSLFSVLLVPFEGNSQCTGISFSASPDKGCAPLSVKFTATGFPTGSSFSWDFGTGFINANDTTNKVFINPKLYDVKMVVTLSGGTKCTVTKQVDVLPSPKPKISITPTSLLCYGTKTVTLYDSTPGSVQSEWVIDGKSYSGTPKNITFTSIGYKPVALRVTNQYGCAGVFSDAKFINLTDSGGIDFCADIVQNPVSGITAKYKPSIYTGGRAVTRYSWSFPGGVPSSDTTANPPTVSYSNLTGKYNASFSFRTADGCVYTKNINDFITPYYSIAKDSGCINSPILLENKAKSGNRTQFGWILQDGDYKTGAGNFDTAKFTTPGLKDVVMLFRYGSGCLNTVSQSKMVKIFGPLARFDIKEKYLCSVNDTVKLFSTSDTFGLKSALYRWEIFDTLGNHVQGSPFNTGNKSFLNTKINKNGVFSVRLTVTGNNGCQDTLRKSDLIVIRQPSAIMKVDSPQVCLGRNIKLTPIVTPQDNVKNPYKFLWQTINIDSPILITNISTKSPEFSPPAPGRYDVMLIIQSGTKCVDTIYSKQLFRVIGVNGRIKYNGPLSGCPPQTGRVHFEYQSKFPDSAYNRLKYSWKVLKTGTASTPNDTGTNINMPSGGCYMASLTVNDSLGCNSKFQIGTGCFGLSSGFHVDVNKCLGQAVGIRDESTNQPQKYKWTVSPSSGAYFTPSDTIPNPSIVYLKDTIFRVGLRVSSKFGNDSCFAYHDTLIQGLELPKIKFTASVKTAFCAPVLVYFQNQSEDAVQYKWYFGDGDSMIVNDTSRQAHLYQKNNPSGFLVRLVGVDSKGCTQTGYFTDSLKIIGPAPKFTPSKFVGCDSFYITFNDQSKNINSFIFDYDDGTPQDTIKLSPHSYKLPPNRDSIRYTPVMLASDDKNCRSYHSENLYLYRSPKANFTILNLSNGVVKGCPPLSVSFQNNSTGFRLKYQWDFDNDGIIDDSVQNPIFIYRKPGVFSVKLTVIGRGGCIDTFSMKDVIHIDSPPRIDFKLSKSFLCDNGLVSFQIDTQNVNKFSFHYDINGDIDNDTVRAKLYNLPPGNLDSIYFYPTLFAQNLLGCRDSVTKTIKLYRAPQANFSADFVTGCNPLKVIFKDSSSRADKVFWDINNDGTFEDSSTNFTQTFGTGSYSVSLKALSKYGCVSTVNKINFITVNPSPKANFSLSDSVVCLGEKIAFKDLSLGNKQIKTRTWIFKSKSITDTSSVNQGELLLKESGNLSIKLTVTNEFNCSDIKDSTLVKVLDSASLGTPEIKYITVLDSYTIAVHYQAPDGKLVKQKVITRLASPTSTAQIFTQTDSVLNDTLGGMFTYQYSYSYIIQDINRCNRLSRTSSTHSTILLKIDSKASNSVGLKWTAYQGWKGLSGYRIYRSIDGINYQQIGQTSPNILSYLDTALCKFKYRYFIEAVESNNGYTSRSNTVIVEPDYIYQYTPLRMNYVTVIDDSFLVLNWQKGIQPNINYYSIDKWDAIFGWKNSFVTTRNTYYSDYSVNPKSQVATYRVSVLDRCNNVSPLSNIGRNILLTSTETNDDVYLEWTHYKEWKEGISYYVVQFKDNNGKFVNLKRVSAEDTQVIVKELLPGVIGSYCFKVLAISFKQDTSASNTHCSALRSRIFIPNAFTPNGDGLNDEWHPFSLSLNPYTGNEFFEYFLRVYNRWGEKVFDTNNPLERWSGIKDGKKVPLGVYIYSLRAKGLDGKNYIMRGNITLLE